MWRTPEVITHAGRLGTGSRCGAISGVTPNADLRLETSERNLIVRALEKTGGNKTKAAALLGISRDVVRYRMNKLKLGTKEE